MRILKAVGVFIGAFALLSLAGWATWLVFSNPGDDVVYRAALGGEFFALICAGVIAIAVDGIDAIETQD
jgi:hypothetical protein